VPLPNQIRKCNVPSTANRESAFRLELLAFGALGAISLAIWWGPVVSTFALALNDQQYTHILLILPICVALIVLDWKAPQPSSRLSVGIGSSLLVSATALAFIVRWKVIAPPADVQLSGNMLAFVLWWIAAFILCFGTGAFRNARFPLLFLLWLVPFPAFLLDPIVTLLQRGSAASAHWLFAVAGVRVEQRGMLLHIPDLTLEVAPECSSIRSSLILLVTSMVVAQLLLRSTWRKIVVVAVAIPLSVAKNGLRIFVIGMLATRVDPGFLTGRLHRQGGVIFLLIALAVIFLIIWILRRGEEERPAGKIAAEQGDHRG
jgi:exosortase